MPKGIYDRSQVKHRSIPGIDEVSHYWDKSESHTIELLLDDGILTFPDVCEKCGTSNAYRFKNKTKKTLRCSVAGCRHQSCCFKSTGTTKVQIHLLPGSSNCRRQHEIQLSSDARLNEKRHIIQMSTLK